MALLHIYSIFDAYLHATYHYMLRLDAIVNVLRTLVDVSYCTFTHAKQYLRYTLEPEK